MVAQAISRQSSGQAVRFWPRGASAELFTHHEPIVIVSGPAGTGKTYGCLWRLHLAALKYPGMRGIMLRKTQEDLTASALVTYQERVLGAGHFGVRPFGGSKLKPAGFQYPNGSELLIGGLDKADKVMSREYDLIYVNEAWELSEDDLEKLSTRARWGVMPYQQIFGDTNPQGPSHHLHKAWAAGKLTMLFSVHKDNPSLWNQAVGDWTDLGRDYLARLDNLTGHRRQRLLDGVWVAAEGVVYPEFNRQTHVQSVDCSGWGTVLGLDVGTRNPTALLTIRHAGDRIHIEHEVYERGLSSDAITDTAVVAYQRSGAAMLVIDPSAAGLIASLVARSIPARKADNDVKVGISRVTSVIPDLTIDPSCENTIREFESYRYPDRGQSQDVPVKENDHCLIAGTLIETDRGSVPIEGVVLGDRVWTRHGLRPVKASGMTNPSVRVYTATLADGRTLTGSSLHPVWVEDRWKFFDELRYGDILSTWKPSSSPLSSTASPSDDIRTQSSGQIARTLSPMAVIASAELVAFTKKSGRRITGRFRRAITSIIGMTIRSITIPTISNVLPHLSIFPCMAHDHQASANGNTSKTSDRWRRNGTDPTRDGLGIANTARTHGLGGSPSNERATNAVGRSRRSPVATKIGSVPTPASRHGVALVALMTRIASAPSAERHSVSTATPLPVLAPVSVVSVFAEPKRQAVYNLAVEDTPEFFANGILVHNSMDAFRYGVMEIESALTGVLFV